MLPKSCFVRCFGYSATFAIAPSHRETPQTHRAMPSANAAFRTMLDGVTRPDDRAHSKTVAINQKAHR